MAVTVGANWWSGIITISSGTEKVTLGLPEFRAIARWVKTKDEEPLVDCSAASVSFSGPDGAHSLERARTMLADVREILHAPEQEP